MSCTESCKCSDEVCENRSDCSSQVDDVDCEYSIVDADDEELEHSKIDSEESEGEEL